VFAVLIVLSLVSGYVGFAVFLHGNTQFGHGPLDLLYDDLQLFVLGPFPLQQGGADLPVALEIGRLTAPLVTIFAFIEAGRLFLAAELRRWRIQRLRGHVVVCGSGPIATVLTQRLGAAGDRVVVVAPSPVDGGKPGRDEVFGDPRQPRALAAAAVRHARTLYACTEDTAANTAIAMAAARTAAGTGPDLAVYVYAPDADLSLALQARHLGRARSSRARIDFFNVDEVAARRAVAEQAHIDGTGDRPPNVLVIGASSFGRAVVVELARHWRATRSAPDVVPTVVLADADASTAVAAVAYRYPFVLDSCDLRAHEGQLAKLLATADPSQRPTAVFVCLADEEAGLRMALTVDGLWHGGPGSVVVRLSQLAGFPDVFHGTEGDSLLDPTDGVLRLFNVVEAACDPSLIREDLVERLARTVHDRYRRARLNSRERQVDSPSMVAWHDLSDVLRRSCRSQAEDISAKLRAIDCTLAPRMGPGEDHRLSDETIEVLARMEQRRWMTERRTADWTYGPSRDDITRRHPDLVPWESLSAVAQEKNRHAMREIYDIVADAGFRIVQL
jgi:hypothetical protein